jgi:hypothetical protein
VDATGPRTSAPIEDDGRRAFGGAVGRNGATGAFEDTFSDRTSLGGVATSDPVVPANADGRAEVFVRGTDNALYHQWQLPDGTWSGWSSLGGVTPGTPAVGINQDGRLAVFVRGTDNGLWIRTQLGAATSSTWSGWTPIGAGLASDPVVTQLANGRLAACYRKADNTIAGQWQLAPNDAGWTDAASLGSPNGGAIGDPSVVVTANGQLQLYVRSFGDGIIHRRASTTADPSAGWSGWASCNSRPPRTRSRSVSPPMGARPCSPWTAPARCGNCYCPVPEACLLVPSRRPDLAWGRPPGTITRLGDARGAVAGPRPDRDRDL